MKIYAHRETWGYSIWQRGVQIGAGVGLAIEGFRLGREMTRAEARIWRKRGVLRLA